MNKKMLFIFIVIGAIIIISTMLGLRSCEPRVKDFEDETEPGNLTGNTEITNDFENLDENNGEKTEDYKSAFINANIDFTCEIINNPSLAKSSDIFKTRLNDAYKRHGLPVTDDTLMIEILNKYENAADVIRVIRANTENCPKK